MVIPLVYHCFVFLTALPLWSVNPASCVILLIGFHTLFLLLVVSYWKVIFTDAGGVPYELDEAWVRDCLLFHAADFCNAFPPCQCMLFEGHAGSFPPTDDARSPVATLRTTPLMHVLQCVRARECVYWRPTLFIPLLSPHLDHCPLPCVSLPATACRFPSSTWPTDLGWRQRFRSVYPKILIIRR